MKKLLFSSKKFLTLALCAMTLTLNACASLELPASMTSTPSDINEVYYGQFTDIPIPKDMSLNAKASLVSTATDGSRAGLETYDGMLDMLSLSNAMIHNMTRAGWKLIGVANGKTQVQIYENLNRLVLLYFSTGMVESTMQVWMLNKLEGNVHPMQQAATNSSFQPATSSAPAPAPANNQNYNSTDTWGAPASSYTEELKQ